MRAFWVRGLVLVGVAALIGGAVLVIDEFGGPDHPPDNRPRAVVALGDSTMAGEGAGDYVPGTNGRDGNWCHRSKHAAVHQIDRPDVDRIINLACSGAPSKQVGLSDAKQYTEPAQASRLADLARKYRIVAVVVATGANDDPHFSRQMDRCIRSFVNPSGQPCSAELRGKPWAQRLDAMRTKVIDALEDIRGVLEDAGYDEDEYQFVVQSYASPVNPNISEDLRSLAGCPFRAKDMRWVRNRAVPLLAEELEQAAQAVGARFLDLSRAGHGHEACTGGADASGEWFARLTVRWQDIKDPERFGHVMQESFHPNARGYREIGRCLTEFLGTSDAQAACLPDGNGQLHAATSVGD